MAKSQAELLEEQLSSLTPEELEEYERELQRSSGKGFAPTESEMAQAKADVEPSTGEALATGFVEGVPFLKDAVAGYDGISQAMEDDDVSFDEAYGNYKKNLDETNTDINNAQKQSPWTAGAGEVAATALTLGAGGAALRGAGAGQVLTSKGIAMASAVGTGAAQQLSRSEDRGPEDLLVGAAIGGVSEAAGNYMMTGVKKTGKYLLDKADDLGANAAKRIMGITNVSAKKSLYKHLKQTGQKESEFLSDVMTQKLKDGNLAVKFSDAPERMLDKVKLKKQELGEEIGKFYKQIDMEHDIKIDLEDLKGSLSDDVVAPFMASDDPGMQQIGMDLDDYIKSIGRKIKSVKRETTPEGTKMIEDIGMEESWGVARVHRLQKDIRKRIETIYKKNGLDLNASKEQQRRVAQSLGKHMDDVIDAVSSDADDLIGKIKLDRKQFGNMSTIQDSLESEIYRAKDDPTAILKEAMGMRSLMISGVASAGVGPAGMLAGPVMNRIIASPKTPLYMASGLKTIGSIVNAAPTGEIAARLNSAALMSNEKFRDTVYGVIGEVNLKQQPVERTTEAIKMRHDDLRNVVKMNKPEQLNEFDAIMDSNDPASIGQFMDSISKLPGVDKMFQGGIGIDGKVYSPEDKAQLESQLKQTDMPGAQRIQMLNELRSIGTVPDFDNIVPEPPKVHVPRARKIEDY